MLALMTFLIKTKNDQTAVYEVVTDSSTGVKARLATAFAPPRGATTPACRRSGSGIDQNSDYPPQTRKKTTAAEYDRAQISKDLFGTIMGALFAVGLYKWKEMPPIMQLVSLPLDMLDNKLFHIYALGFSATGSHARPFPSSDLMSLLGINKDAIEDRCASRSPLRPLAAPQPARPPLSRLATGRAAGGRQAVAVLLSNRCSMTPRGFYRRRRIIAAEDKKDKKEKKKEKKEKKEKGSKAGGSSKKEEGEKDGNSDKDAAGAEKEKEASEGVEDEGKKDQ